jgi:hypothetical protein
MFISLILAVTVIGTVCHVPAPAYEKAVKKFLNYHLHNTYMRPDAVVTSLEDFFYTPEEKALVTDISHWSVSEFRAVAVPLYTPIMIEMARAVHLWKEDEASEDDGYTREDFDQLLPIEVDRIFETLKSFVNPSPDELGHAVVAPVDEYDIL